jgi:hypothetical protein
VPPFPEPERTSSVWLPSPITPRGGFFGVANNLSGNGVRAGGATEDAGVRAVTLGCLRLTKKLLELDDQWLEVAMIACNHCGQERVLLDARKNERKPGLLSQQMHEC